MDVILPEAAIKYLPFASEPLSQWNSKSDLAQFNDAIYKHTIYPPFGRLLYRESKKRFRLLAKQFTKYAQEASPVPKANVGPIAIPNFAEDPMFGKAAKYASALRCCVQSVLEESAFYSFAHTLEAEDDINCSLLLASHLYYKQALQVLRSFIEDLILPIHFSEYPQEFSKWKTNIYRVPPLRGRDGILSNLVGKQILSNEIANTVSSLYGELNGSIHGSESQLINKGAHSVAWSGLVFKYDAFCEWCGYLSRSIDVGIRLLKVNYSQWEHFRSSKTEVLKSRGKVLCSVCHNEEDFDVQIFSPDDLEVEAITLDSKGRTLEVKPARMGFIIYHCLHCGHEITAVCQELCKSVESG